MTSVFHRATSLVLLLLLGLGSTLPLPTAAQSCSFDGTLDVNPEELVLASDSALGNESADLFLIEFFDPNCPHCQRFHPVMKQVLETHGDKIRFVMQPVPLWQFSTDQMRAMLIAQKKGKYYDMVDAQLTSPHAGKGGMTIDQLVELARQTGIDAEWMREQLTNAETMGTEVRLLVREARKSGIESTPTLAIGRKIVGNRTAPCIRKLIDRSVESSSTE